MRKIKCLLLACLMMVSAFTYNAFAAVPETVMPLWENTSDVSIAHCAEGTTAHCTVDIGVHPQATMMNVSIRLIAMSENPQRIVKEWKDPEMTVDTLNTHSFYGTVDDIVPGNIYQLVFQCEVWRSGVCDYISQAVNAIY